jgi:hypothetical protein
MIENTRISFVNVKNLKANLVYTKFLAYESDILYLSELWCKQNEINLIKTLDHDNKSKTILFKSDIDNNYKKGRPFGGQAWVFNKSYTIIKHEFLNRHLSYIHHHHHHRAGSPGTSKTELLAGASRFNRGAGV